MTTKLTQEQVEKRKRARQISLELENQTFEQHMQSLNGIDKAIEQAEVFFEENREKYVQKQEETNKNEGLRRIPVGDLLSQKITGASFLIYAHLQQISNWKKGQDYRYIYEKDLDMKEIKKKTGIKDNRTLNTKLKKLEQCGMIVRVEEKGEQVIQLPCVGDYYVLLDLQLEDMKAILKHCSEMLFRVFLFHKSYSRTLGKKEYSVTRDYIARCIGSSQKNEECLQEIIECCRVLRGFELLQFEKRAVQNSKGALVTKYFFKYCGR